MLESRETLSSSLCFQNYYDIFHNLSLAKTNTSGKEFVPLRAPSSPQTPQPSAGELHSLSPLNKTGRGEVKSTPVCFIRTKKQRETKKQTQTSSLSSLPCYESAFVFAGLLTIFQNGTSHTASSGTADIVSAARQLLAGLYFTKIRYKAFL